MVLVELYRASALAMVRFFDPSSASFGVGFCAARLAYHFSWAVQVLCLASHLHNAVADGAVLPLPQQHQADDDDCGDRHGDDQQANQSTASKAEVLTQRTECFLLHKIGRERQESQMNVFSNVFQSNALIVKWGLRNSLESFTANIL